MSYFIEKQGTIEHEYFQAGPGRKIYLGRKDKSDSAKSENVFKALDYLDQKNIKHYELYDILLAKLPQKQKEEYISKRLNELNKHMDKDLLKQLPDTDQKEYYERMRNEYRDRLRQLEKELQKVTAKKPGIMLKLKEAGDKLLGEPALSAASPTREEPKKKSETSKPEKKKRKK